MSSGSSIRELPSGTAQLLTATQVITSPLSAVKELLENSLDARATIISIEIASNTLDRIQVRDNGHGIAPEDRGICCRRHTTSKITSMEDLTAVGGMSLGFRGEALFAIAQVSGEMIVTTRVEGESAAVKHSINATGDVTKRETASQAVGTTVRVTNFFDKLPVRKQNAVKSASKTLLAIRKMLQAYVLARPHVRIQFRIHKAKTTSGNFAYGPRAGAATVHDAAFKIIGTEVASQCTWHMFQSGDFEVQALLPSSDAEAANINNAGHFISIDRRPVSTTRGFLKTLNSSVLARIRASSSVLANIKDPFYVLNVDCPVGSYDPNIEPAKNDVVFDESDAVLGAVAELLDAVYAKVQQEEESSQISGEHGVDASIEDTGEHVGEMSSDTRPQLYGNPIHKKTLDDHATGPFLTASDRVEMEEPDLRRRQRSLVSSTPVPNVMRSEEIMPSRLDDDDPNLFDVASSNRPATATTDSPALRQMTPMNPWSIAKMNAFDNGRAIQQGEAALPSLPRARSLSPTSQRRFRNGVLTSRQGGGMSANKPFKPPFATPWSTDRMSGGAMISQVHPSGLPTPAPSSSPERSSVERSIKRKACQAGQERLINQAFKPPAWYHTRKQADSRTNRTSTDELYEPTLQFENDLCADNESPSAGGISARSTRNSRRASTVVGEDDMAAEFRSQLLRAGEEMSQQYTGHQSANIHLFETENTTPPCYEPPVWTAISPSDELITHDKRPPSSRRRRTTEGKRSKSSRLPLERVPPRQEVQNLVSVLSLSIVDFEKAVFFADFGEYEHSLDPPSPSESIENYGATTQMCLKAINLLRHRLHLATSSGDGTTSSNYSSVLEALTADLDQDI